MLFLLTASQSITTFAVHMTIPLYHTHTQEPHIYTHMCGFLSICKFSRPQHTHTHTHRSSGKNLILFLGLSHMMRDPWYQCSLCSLLLLGRDTLPRPATQSPEENDYLGPSAWNGAKQTTPKPELSEAQGSKRILCSSAARFSKSSQQNARQN